MTPFFKYVLIVFSCLFAVLAQAEEDDPYGADIQLSRTKPTDPAVLVSLVGEHEMEASKIKVGHVSDGKPLLCFKDPDKQLVGCFVLNMKTDQVVFVHLPADEKTL